MNIQTISEFTQSLEDNHKFLYKESVYVVGTDLEAYGGAYGGDTGVVVLSQGDNGIYGIALFSNDTVVQLETQDDYYEFFENDLPKFFEHNSVCDKKVNWGEYGFNSNKDYAFAETFTGLKILAEEPYLDEDECFCDLKYENPDINFKSDSNLFLEDSECEAKGFWYLSCSNVEVTVSPKKVSFVGYCEHTGNIVNHKCSLDQAFSEIYGSMFLACFDEDDDYCKSMILFRPKDF